MSVQILLISRNGQRYDLTRIYQSMTWSGDSSQIYRDLVLTVAAPDRDGIPHYSSELGNAVQLMVDGEQRFLGTVVTRKRSTDGHTYTLTCRDRGWQLSGNEEWYSFDCTPEQATRILCRDFGIPVGTLAATGIRVARKFPGVALHRIIGTMYTKASEQSGRQYAIYFDGQGRLNVTQKPSTATLTLAPKVNLVSSTLTEDAKNICTAVSIYSEAGTHIRTLTDNAAVKLYGTLQHVITQKDEDVSADARTWLAENGEQQTLTVECLGDPRLLSGSAVALLDNASGAKGLFWVESDSHRWRNGQYLCSLTLNFRNLMAKTTAGQEPSSGKGKVEDNDDWSWIDAPR